MPWNKSVSYCAVDSQKRQPWQPELHHNKYCTTFSTITVKRIVVELISWLSLGFGFIFHHKNRVDWGWLQHLLNCSQLLVGLDLPSLRLSLRHLHVSANYPYVPMSLVATICSFTVSLEFPCLLPYFTIKKTSFLKWKYNMNIINKS